MKSRNPLASTRTHGWPLLAALIVSTWHLPSLAGNAAAPSAACSAAQVRHVSGTLASADEAWTDELAASHPEQLADALVCRAEQGDVAAMERVGLMHWYGAALYATGAWNPELGRAWLERAAASGSVVARHMLTQPRVHARLGSR